MTTQNDETLVNSSHIQPVEQLVETALCITKIIGGTNISGFYRTPRKDSGMRFISFYRISDGEIERILLDPKANSMDPGSTHGQAVSKKEFIDWMMQNPLRQKDVYSHLMDYFKRTPQMVKELENTKPTNSSYSQDYI